MPKTFISEAEQFGSKVYTTIKTIYSKRQVYDDKPICTDIGLNPTTFCHRKRHIFYLTTYELSQMAKKRRLTDEEIVQIVRGG